ncbi:tRNA lysidine(34) synthetase TilS [uncultured Tateyamaria sp.]|uniref:tRNA lysidine(34) synthetase TilS n=1 Tax=uncultured Tateyamaria sp. TaxID=455651 RepID=UPI0026295FFD|nr:tRNA lysidine(34) synthetase TilS [uncultured Tateyamaria sp.]
MLAPLLEAIAEQLSGRPPERLGVAVSGGGDSVALLAALVEHVKGTGTELSVITVNHGLRPEAKEEVALVTDLCARWNLSHHVEYWKGWSGEGNLQSTARDARYELMADWAYGNGVTHIALGHTADDQAETFIMRLARGAGVDGLSAMAPRRVRYGVTWVRPFLRIERSALRTYLTAAQLSWCEDPSNENPDFERVRVRDALTVLGSLGVHTDTLVDVAHNMSQAREALDWQTFLAARETATIRHGVVAMDLRSFRMLPDEIRRRLLIHAVRWTSGSAYAPRRAAVAHALAAVRASETVTLDGCQITVENDIVWVFRELNAVKDFVSEVGDLWDDRWLVSGPEDDPDIEVRALGYDALSEVEGWRDLGLPRAAMAAMPSVWYDQTLMAVPVTGVDPDWTAELDNGQDAFFAALLSH